MPRMRTRWQNLAYAYSLPLWNILEFDSYVIRGCQSRGTGGAPEARAPSRRREGITKFALPQSTRCNPLQCPNVRRKTPRV